MAKSQSVAEALKEELTSEDVKAHLDAAQGSGDQSQGSGDGSENKSEDKPDGETQPSVVAGEKYYRCKAPTTYMKDHGTGIVYNEGAAMKSPLTGFLMSQIEAGKMEECNPPE